MTHEERIAFCKVCTNKRVDFERGIVCDLTSNLPDFEDNCKSYVLDEQALHRQAAIANNINDQSETADGQRDMIWGAIWCLGGLFATLADIGYIFYGAIIFGGFQFIRGWIATNGQ